MIAFRQQFRGRITKMRNSLLLSVAAASLLTAATSALADSWVPLTPPSGSQSATLFGVNDKNIATGGYVDASGNTHGFLGPFDGSNYTSFDDNGTGTQPRGLNDKSTVMGFDTGTLQQWERSPTGTLKNVTQGGTPVALALAQGINKSNIFTGDYLNASGVETGAIGQKHKYTKDIKLSFSNSGYAGRAIDSAGDLAGWYFDPSTGLQRGFAIIAGTAMKIDYPHAAYTVVEGLNDHGIISGQYQDSSGAIHGFIYTISTNKYKALNVSGATLTQVWGISNGDVVAASSDVGSYAYCLKAKSCPTPGGVVHPHRIPGFRPASP
jgi:hypothetical protein